MIYAELLALAQTAKDQDKTLLTKTGKPFKVGIYRDVPFFIPNPLCRVDPMGAQPPNDSSNTTTKPSA